jgi:MFS-type transporter involved in bile tolerance (Atg22 family)
VVHVRPSVSHAVVDRTAIRRMLLRLWCIVAIMSTVRRWSITPGRTRMHLSAVIIVAGGRRR